MYYAGAVNRDDEVAVGKGNFFRLYEIELVTFRGYLVVMYELYLKLITTHMQPNHLKLPDSLVTQSLKEL